MVAHDRARAVPIDVPMTDSSTKRATRSSIALENSPGTIGLSEISLVGVTHGGQDVYAVIERDNRLAGNAALKRIYTFTLSSLQPVDIATPVSVSTIAGAAVTKSLFRDILPDFTPYEKVEGLTLTVTGDLWIALDNDGGEFESRLVRLRRPFGY